jgi:hypothetical protein
MAYSVVKTELQAANHSMDAAFFANQTLYVRKLMAVFRFRATRKTG